VITQPITACSRVYSAIHADTKKNDCTYCTVYIPRRDENENKNENGRYDVNSW